MLKQLRSCQRNLWTSISISYLIQFQDECWNQCRALALFPEESKGSSVLKIWPECSTEWTDLKYNAHGNFCSKTPANSNAHRQNKILRIHIRTVAIGVGCVISTFSTNTMQQQTETIEMNFSLLEFFRELEFIRQCSRRLISCKYQSSQPDFPLH